MINVSGENCGKNFRFKCSFKHGAKINSNTDSKVGFFFICV